MIVDTAVHALVTGIREALTIWLALVALTAAACMLLSAPVRRDRRRRHPQWTPTIRKAARPQPERPQPEELRRYAEEVTVAANRAAEAAERWRAEWLAVQSAKDAAWRAYERADEVARRTYEAAAFPTPLAALTPDELTARERYLHRAVREAYERGELTLRQLHDALWHRNGWDPARHPFEQQVILRRVGLERKLQAYRTVAAMERKAWESVQVADAAKGSLRREAFTAQARVWAVAHGQSSVEVRATDRSPRYRPTAAAASATQ